MQEVIDFIAYKIERSDSEIAKRLLKNYFAGMQKIVENPPPPAPANDPGAAAPAKAAEPAPPPYVSRPKES